MVRDWLNSPRLLSSTLACRAPIISKSILTEYTRRVLWTVDVLTVSLLVAVGLRLNGVQPVRVPQ